MNSELETIVKRKCNITWNDTETNNRITEIVEDAIETLRYKLGINKEMKVEFSKAGEERNLFKNYCFYEWNNKVSEFDKNYKTEILQLKQKYEVMQNVSEE